MNPLREMFLHHAWATGTLFDVCAALPAAELQQTVAGTYGTVIATLVHLVAADQRYLEVMTGRPASAPIRERTEPLLATLSAAFEAQSATWQTLVDAASTLDVTIPARGPRPPAPHAEDLLFVQAINHGNDHRTHICTILGARGVKVPDLDGWSYWSATRPTAEA